jgi:hypothetical protein
MGRTGNNGEHARAISLIAGFGADRTPPRSFLPRLTREKVRANYKATQGPWRTALRIIPAVLVRPTCLRDSNIKDTIIPECFALQKG